MNFDYCFTKQVPSAFIFVLFVVTACTSVAQTPSTQVDETPAGQSISAPEEPGTASIPDSDLAPTDPEVMEHVFAAEVLGAEGDISGAAAQYLEAALASNDPEIAERAARIAVSADEWQMVVLASDRWAMLAPESLDARQLAAGSRLREGDYAGAEYQLEQILEMTKHTPALGWKVVISLLAPANDQVRANKVLNNLMAGIDPTSNVDALYARSQLAARAGELDKAEEFIDQAIKLQPDRADFLAWSGRLAVNREDMGLALQRYKQAWEASAGDPAIAMAYAELLKRENEPAAAQEVLAVLPDTPEMRFSRMIFALEVKDRQNAEKLYRGFSEISYPNASNAAFQAAQGAELLEHYREAINWYQQVTGERSLRAVMRQAFLLAQLGEINEARNLLAQLRMQGDESVRSQSYQAEIQILQRARRIEEAMDVVNTALATLPGDFALRYVRALLAVGLGQLELAENDLREIIAVQPDNAAALNALGYTLADMTDRYEEAEILIFRAYELQPNESSIIDSMGWIAYRMGRMKEAEQYLRQAWTITQAAEIAAHLGEVLWVSGQKDEARLAWQSGARVESENEVLIKTMQRFGEMP